MFNLIITQGYTSLNYTEQPDWHESTDNNKSKMWFLAQIKLFHGYSITLNLSNYDAVYLKLM